MHIVKSVIVIGILSIAQVAHGKKSITYKAYQEKTSKEEFKSEKEKLVKSWQERNIISNPEIIRAFNEVARELFTLPKYQNKAYLDQPLPIFGGQTISQPTTVVLMLNALDIKPGQKIFEIGAGSGYNAALIGKIVGPCGKVFSTEIVPELVTFAKTNLKKADIENVTVLDIDGSKGYFCEAPFNRIIVTAGAPSIPLALIDQLADDGILLMPIDANGYQKMYRFKKSMNALKIEELGRYSFVPLTGEYGKKK